MSKVCSNFHCSAKAGSFRTAAFFEQHFSKKNINFYQSRGRVLSRHPGRPGSNPAFKFVSSTNSTKYVRRKFVRKTESMWKHSGLRRKREGDSTQTGTDAAKMGVIVE